MHTIIRFMLLPMLMLLGLESHAALPFAHSTAPPQSAENQGPSKHKAPEAAKAVQRNLDPRALLTPPKREAVFSPDGNRLAETAQGSGIQVRTMGVEDEAVRLTGHRNGITAMVFSPGSQRLLTAGGDLLVKLWDLDTSQLIYSLAGHAAPVRDAAFSSDGRFILTASDDGTVRLWDTESGRMLGGHQRRTRLLTFTPDRRYALSVDMDDPRLMRRWEAVTGKTVGYFQGHNKAVTRMAYAPGGLRMATADAGGGIILWEAHNQNPISILEGHTAPVTELVFSQDGTMLLSADRLQSWILWDARTGQPLQSVQAPPGGIMAATLHGGPPAKPLFLGERGMLRIWDSLGGGGAYTLLNPPTHDPIMPNQGVEMGMPPGTAGPHVPGAWMRQNAGVPAQSMGGEAPMGNIGYGAPGAGMPGGPALNSPGMQTTPAMPAQEVQSGTAIPDPNGHRQRQTPMMGRGQQAPTAGPSIPGGALLPQPRQAPTHILPNQGSAPRGLIPAAPPAVGRPGAGLLQPNGQPTSNRRVALDTPRTMQGEMIPGPGRLYPSTAAGHTAPMVASAAPLAPRKPSARFSPKPLGQVLSAPPIPAASVATQTVNAPIPATKPIIQRVASAKPVMNRPTSTAKKVRKPQRAPVKTKPITQKNTKSTPKKAYTWVKPKKPAAKPLHLAATPNPETVPMHDSNSVVDADTGITFVKVPGGCFTMGGNDKHLTPPERPAHKVCVKPFWMSRFEVTQGQWQSMMKKNPSFFKLGPNYPVEQVSWDDTQRFIRKINRKVGRQVYQLPTEAQWEFACRSGGRDENYCGSDNLSAVGWHKGNGGLSTHAVGLRRPNGLGLFDMTGNVLEWTRDGFQANYYSKSPKQDPSGPKVAKHRTARGGSWRTPPPDEARATLRHDLSPKLKHASLGFRVIRATPPRPARTVVRRAGERRASAIKVKQLNIAQAQQPNMVNGIPRFVTPQAGSMDPPPIILPTK
ncbi:SUMF1/EgtB/PvdO family nonheme iron enzyme [Magnetococcus sp. PR-3]|uniref:SUMF1/EgtB/PvdO family nonheme iron enzyme n=1 Tax=Magnetococcus sp. PR-3 TaxID=3120355 RepID=UPI002FCDF71E